MPAPVAAPVSPERYPTGLSAIAGARLAALPPEDGEPLLTNRTVLRLYWPLALSWILMSVEGPVCSRVISTFQSAAEVNLAAYQIFFTLAMWFESPVIDLLSTSTTLVKGRITHMKLRRFTLGLMLWVTVIHGLVALTPIFDWICSAILKVEPSVANAARPGFIAMLPWSAAIGWRRYLQGILISRGQTRSVGLGTVVRVSTVALTAFGLTSFASLAPSVIVGVVLISGVIAEAIFIHAASRQSVHEIDLIDDAEEGAKLNSKKLYNFHIPLSLTTLVALAGPPSVAAAIDRLGNPVATLAAFQLSNNFLWMLRSFTYALPEVVITLYRNPQTARVLRNFAVRVGVIASSFTALVGLTGLATWYFSGPLNAPYEVAKIAAYGVALGIAMPAIAAGQSYIRGMLTAHHLTVSRFVANGIGIAVLVLGLVAGVQLHGDGMMVSVVAPTFAMASELMVLTHFWKAARVDLAKSS